MNRPIIDIHCDTLMQATERDLSFREMPDNHINLIKLKKGGSLVQCFAAFININPEPDPRGILCCEKLRFMTPYEQYCAMLKHFRKQMDENSDLIKQVRASAEIEEGIGGDKLMALLTIEDAAPLEGKLERVDEFYNDGVRMMSLTHNWENCLAWPNSSNNIAHNTRGLKPFGFDVIERMNKLGMIIDVSHLSERGFWEIIEKSSKPIISSHACARAISGHQRNLSDWQLRALAEKGGMVGLNFYAPFIEENNNSGVTIAQVLEHVRHIVKVAGVDTLGFGSDFDGMETTVEWEDFAGMPRLVQALEPYFTDDELDKICYKNFLRVLKDNEVK